MNKRTHGKERRLFPRLITRKVVYFETCALPNRSGISSPRGSRGVLVNISNKAICLRTNKQFQKDMVLKVRIPFNEISPTTPTLVQVLWVKKDPKSNKNLTGMRFII